MPCWIEFDLFPPLSETWQKKKACWHGRLTRKDTHLTVERLVPLTQLCHFSPWASVFPSVQWEGWIGPPVAVMLRVPVADSLLKTENFKLPWFFLEIFFLFLSQGGARESHFTLWEMAPLPWGPHPLRTMQPRARKPSLWPHHRPAPPAAPPTFFLPAGWMGPLPNAPPAPKSLPQSLLPREPKPGQGCHGYFCFSDEKQRG